MKRCKCITKDNKKCKNKTHDEKCHLHISQEIISPICAICLNKPSLSTKGECSHAFCKKCIYKWLYTNSTCPICRSFAGDRLLHQARTYGFATNEIKIVKIIRFNVTDICDMDLFVISQIFSLNTLIPFGIWEAFYKKIDNEVKQIFDNVPVENRKMIVKNKEYWDSIYITFS
jgi:hypothetical protein